MTATFDFDRLLASVLETGGPQAVPETVVQAALAKARAVPQRRPRVRALDRQAWPAPRFSPASRTSQLPSYPVRVLILALVVTALVALGVVGSALLREDPTPKELQSTFFHHFEYAFPTRGDMRISGTAHPDMVAWADGPLVWPFPSGEEGGYVGGQPLPGQMRGLVIGSGRSAWSHGDGGRFMLRTTPADFLGDLRDVAGVQMSAIAETTLDGRSALTVTLPGFSGSDIHVTGNMQGLTGGSGPNYFVVRWPSRLVVADIDGTIVFVFIWARTGAELSEWLPVADEFVASIHFLPQ